MLHRNRKLKVDPVGHAIGHWLVAKCHVTRCLNRRGTNLNLVVESCNTTSLLVDQLPRIIQLVK